MTSILSPLRIDRITASRLPVVLGISPYTSPAGLMREMVREHFGDESEFTGNIATDWGNEHEADVVAEYELTRGIQVHRSGAGQETWVHPELDFLAATPDGVTADRVVECKAPWRGLYTSIAERPDYAAQLQLQMEVTGLSKADLVIWRRGQPLTVDTLEHDPDWIGVVLPKVTKFLGEYAEVLADPDKVAAHREPPKDVRTDAEWAVQAREWLEVDYLVKQLTTAREAAAAKLFALAPDKPARGGGIDLLRFERKGTVQYPRVLADLHVAVDLDAYRGAPSQVTSIRRIGAKK